MQSIVGAGVTVVVWVMVRVEGMIRIPDSVRDRGVYNFGLFCLVPSSPSLYATTVVYAGHRSLLMQQFSYTFSILIISHLELFTEMRP